MQYKQLELKKGIKLHTIKSDKFKTNLISVFLTVKLNREEVTKKALIPSVLRRGSKNMQTQEKINKELEELYGASFDCGLDKAGDNQVLKFYMETINDNYLPETNENILKLSLEKLLELVFDPYLENDCFSKEYVDQEKNNLRNIIESKIDNKARYALDRCIEEMYKNEPFGLYKFGYVEDLDKISENDLYKAYQEVIKNSKIDIFITGNIDENIIEELKKNDNIRKLQDREPKYEAHKIERREPKKENTITESMDVMQGKLVIGLNINIDNEKDKYIVLMYNNILGGSATSKMFQNIREKEHLAYVANSMYFRHKNAIFINCGIEIENYDKTLNLTKHQLDDMKKGNFTEEDINNSKKGIIATIKGIEDEQDTMITYCFGQELSQTEVTLEEYKDIIEGISKEQIVNIANRVDINTVYFLKN